MPNTPEVYTPPEAPNPLLKKKINKTPPKDNDQNTVSPKDRVEDTRFRINRRSFLRKAVLGGALITIEQLIARGYITKWIFNPETDIFGNSEREAVNKQETSLLYLFNGYDNDQGIDGIKQFTKNVAIVSKAVNKDTFNQINFYDKGTWGTSSTDVLFKGLDNFFKDILTQSGRNNIRSLIDTNVPTYKEEYYGNLQKIENYLKSKNLPININLDSLRAFMLTPKEGLGLGYNQEEVGILFDTLNSYRSSNINTTLTQRINQFNAANNIPYSILN